MKPSKLQKLKRGAGRVTAIASGLALATGLSLVAISPAQAATGEYDESDVYASDINPSSADGWHAQGAAAITSSGLELGATAGLAYTYKPDYGPDVIVSLRGMVFDGHLSLTTSAGSASLQIPIAFGTSSTTLQSASASGSTTTTLDDVWKTSAPIGTSYAAGDTAPLTDLLAAIGAEDNLARVLGFGVSANGSASTVTGIDWWGSSYTFHPENRVPAGTVTVTGDFVVGSVLTAVPAGWPADTTFTYMWIAGGEGFGGPIDGATSATYTLTSAEAGLHVGVIITANKTGFGPNMAQTASDPAVAKPAAPAPVADSADLGAYLSSKGETTQTQSSVGLPGGSLNPGEDYTASVDWTAGDGFVDVYVYSAPTFVGSFPVVNGSVQITLSSAVLSTLASGPHTLVAIGQTSGSVQAVALSVAQVLPATGADITAPLTIGALLLLLGSTLLVVRRRRVTA